MASPWYDLVIHHLGALVFRRLRSGMLESASGWVLEAAGGTGWNLTHYPVGVDIVTIDLSPGMLAKARKHGASNVANMDAEHLAFRDGIFDTVVSTLGTCTFLDPLEALREIRRTYRPGGRILLLEQGRSNRPKIAEWQDRRVPKHTACLG